MSQSPFFMAHHPPVGAWASLTFGMPGRGVSIDHEKLKVSDTADLLVAYSQGSGKTVALPFVTGAAAADHEGQHARPANATSGSYAQRWKFLEPAQIRRTITACVDEFATERMTLRVYTPHPSIPNPKRMGNPQFSVVPGILLEVTIDNSHSDEPAQGFVGLGYHGQGRIRPMDWSTNGALVGVGLGSNWALAALAQKDLLFTVRDNVVAEHVELGQPIIHNGGNEGGIFIKVKPREVKTIPLVFAFYHGGPVTQGIEGTYYYTRFFMDLESVCNFVLRSVGRVKESCDVFDKRIVQMCPDENKRAALAVGLRAYNANTQIIESNNIPYYSVNEGEFCWRNTLDLAVDHLPWELYRNPWVSRNIFDLYSAHYSYRDEVVFPSDPEPAKLQPGGLSFCHDVGSYTVYSPAGASAYEMPDRKDTYAYMTSEELLNGVYLLTSYALMSDDEPWSRTRLATARELLDSMEARDHHDPAQRNGILKADSSIVGIKGAEVTTYASLDDSLRVARGNLYLAVKTWCANLLLTAYFQQHQDEETAQRAYNMAHLTANTLVAAFKTDQGIFPANLFTPSASRVLAALEPMAIPAFCNLATYFNEFPDFLAKLKQHAQSCLARGQCLDANSGGLKLTSSSPITYPSKAALILHVLESVLGMTSEAYPDALGELAKWAQTGGAQASFSDKIDAATGAALGSSYYPRLASSAIWLKTTPA